MKLLFVSDTHGSMRAWKDIEKNFKLDEFDGIFHLGDVLYHGPRNPIPDEYDPKELAERLKNFNINYIRGNCDADVDLKVLGVEEMPKISMEYFGDFSFLLVHGEIFEENDVKEFLKNKNVHFLIHGHTHIAKIEEMNGQYVINPGSTTLPKENTPRSVMVMEVNEEHLHVKFYNLDSGQVYIEKIWTLKGSKLSME
ncbi:MAG: phosphodiesterase [Fervidobacterium sp.]